METEESTSNANSPTRAQIDAAKAALCSKGVFPPKGTETGINCWGAFFAGSIVGQTIETGWTWGFIMVLSAALAFYFGKESDNNYEKLVWDYAKSRMDSTEQQK